MCGWRQNTFHSGICVRISYYPLTSLTMIRVFTKQLFSSKHEHLRLVGYNLLEIQRIYISLLWSFGGRSDRFCGLEDLKRSVARTINKDVNLLVKTPKNEPLYVIDGLQEGARKFFISLYSVKIIQILLEMQFTQVTYNDSSYFSI